MGDEGEGCALAVAGWEDPRRQPSQVGDEMQTAATSVQAVLACNRASTASGPLVPHTTMPCQFAK